MPHEPSNARTVEDFINASCVAIGDVMSVIRSLRTRGMLQKLPYIALRIDESEDELESVWSRVSRRLSERARGIDKAISADGRREDYGLQEGTELSLKLHVFNHRKHKLYDALNRIEGFLERTVEITEDAMADLKPAWHSFRKALQKPLEVMATIMDSIPGLHFAVEFVEIFLSLTEQ